MRDCNAGFFLSDLLSASFQTVNRHARRIWNGPHTTSWDSVFQRRGRRKKPTSPPWTAPALDQSVLLHLQAMKGGLCVKTLSCSSEFPHLTYVAFDDPLIQDWNTQDPLTFVAFYFLCNLLFPFHWSLDFTLFSVASDGDAAKYACAFQPSLLASTCME